MELLIVLLIGYLIGSVPFALVIGKVFYNVDIRNEGSGNLGGTNAGRTLGKKAGISVMLLDILKAFVAMQIAGLVIRSFNFDVNQNYAGLACVFGHCYPVFAKFKGGKGVAAAAGFILALNPLLLVIAIVILVINLKIHHMVSLAVIITLLALLIITSTIPMFSELRNIIIILFIFITFQHRSNIKRIIDGSERKVTWI